jgi:hypothetical protein
MSLNVYASKALIQACSPNGFSKKDIITLKAFASKSDVINPNGKCLDIITAEHKEELFKRVLNMKFPGIQIKSTGSVIRKKCGANFKNKYGILKNFKTTNSSKTSSKLVIQNNKTANYIYGELSVDITCQVSTDGYNLDFSIKGNGIKLKNTAYLAKNSKLEIGSIVKNANSDTTTINPADTSKKVKSNIIKNVKVYIIAN